MPPEAGGHDGALGGALRSASLGGSEEGAGSALNSGLHSAEVGGRKICRLALTPGEPAGVGPDLALALASGQTLASDCAVVLLADSEMLRARSETLGLSLRLPEIISPGEAPPGFSILHVPLSEPVSAGCPDPANAPSLLRALEIACDGCLNGVFDALVTGPLSKSVINDAGFAFTGHTEFLAQRAGAGQAVMMLAVDSLRVALATTHLPLSAVSATITEDLLVRCLQVIDTDLRRFFTAGRKPRIAVTGLNPHAGEDGRLGREEMDVIRPAIERGKAMGLDLSGPHPADTVFIPSKLGQWDLVLAMYHDQGLPIIKHIGFDRAVNVTLGLPIIRTSVDHGVALDLAATGGADSGSLQAALNLAAQMARTQMAGKGG